MNQQTKEVLKTEFKLGLAEALIQVLGYKREAFVFNLLRMDTRQRHIIRERRKMTADLWRRVIRQWPYCLKCGSIESLQADHVVSLYHRGKTEWSNLQTLCGKCNRQKGIKTADYRR